MRWDKLKQLLSETQTIVELNIETKKVYDELHAIQELMGTYEKWVNSSEVISGEASEINRQMEQCKVKKYR